ncbi:MAG: hypothetical protein AB1631_21305 [Acidobacteriota bacterium]
MEHTYTTEAVVKSLGSKQQAVLLWLHRWTLTFESDPNNQVYRFALNEGIPWMPKHAGNIASSRAVYSRTIRKLEEKGLIERIRRASTVRSHTQKLKITALGREVARQIKVRC